jgi:hypothetical protein
VYPSFSVAEHMRLGAALNPGWDRALAEERVERLGLDRRQRAGNALGRAAGVNFKYQLAPNTPHTPAFQPALAACRHLLPGHVDTARTPVQIAAFVAFAGCMRSHGFANFPDPTSHGQLTHAMLTTAGIDIHLPAVLQAADACVSVIHGNITQADVARFATGH